MSKEIKDLPVHDQIMLMLRDYSYWNERFEHYGYFKASVRARRALIKLRQLCNARYREIGALRAEPDDDSALDDS